MFRKSVLITLALAGVQAAWCQPTVQPPYSSDYTVVSLGPGLGALTFLNPSTLLITGGEGSTGISSVPVTRAANGHVTSLGTPVVFASGAPGLDAGLAFGPGGVLFAVSYSLDLYEFKTGSTNPDLTVALSSFGYSGEYATLQFVPRGFSGAGVLKVPNFESGGWYDIGLVANGLGTYDVTGVTGPNVTANANPFGIFYVPLGSSQFTSPSVLVNQGYRGPIWAYPTDADGNPTGSGTPFVGGGFYPYGAAFDPLTGDMLFTNYDDRNVYAVQGFSPGALTATSGNPQSAIVANQFGSPLTVTLTDPYGKPIRGVTVHFAAPTSGATAKLSARSAVTAADGTASVTADANDYAGSYVVTATVYGLSATFSLTNVEVESVALSPASVLGGNSTTANTVTLTSSAPPDGATITLTSSNPAVAVVPASVTVTEGSTISPPFTITTSPVAAVTQVTITASDGIHQRAATLTVRPAVLTAVELSPKFAVGGKSTTGNTVTLNGEAPSAGAVVTLLSSDPTVAAVPASVTVPAGVTVSPVFTITTTAVAVQTPVTISATLNSVTKSGTLTVVSPKAALLKLSSTSVVGGKSTKGNVVALDGPAPAGGAVVTLSSGDPSVAAPPTTVTVAAGANYATFPITTTTVTTSTVVPITATFGGASVMANLTVTP